jgi:hypothetical protein
MTDYSPVLHCVGNSAILLEKKENRHKVSSHMRPSMARICDHFAGKILSGKIALPERIESLYAIKFHIDVAAANLRGWSIEVSSKDTPPAHWESLDPYLSDQEKAFVDTVASDALEHCPGPKQGYYCVLHHATISNLSSHDIIQLVASQPIAAGATS